MTHWLRQRLALLLAHVGGAAQEASLRGAFLLMPEPRANPRCGCPTGQLDESGPYQVCPQFTLCNLWEARAHQHAGDW